MSPDPRKHRKNEDLNEAAFRVVREALGRLDPSRLLGVPGAL